MKFSCNISLKFSRRQNFMKSHITIHGPKFANLLRFHPRAQNVRAIFFMIFFRNADSVLHRSGQCKATKYISCIFEAKFFINRAIKSTTLLAHVVFSTVYSSKANEINNSRAHERYRQTTDRQMTDGRVRQHTANVNVYKLPMTK